MYTVRIMENTRNNMFSVMNHSGYGTCEYNTKYGVTFVLPQSAITKLGGRIKKNVLKMLDKNLTIGDIEALKIKYGVEVIVENASLYLNSFNKELEVA